MAIIKEIKENEEVDRDEPESSIIATAAEEVSAAEKVAGHQDYLNHILQRLRANDLLRCCLVSKGFNSLISDPQFRLSHTLFNKNPRISGLILSNNFYKLGFQFIPIDTKFNLKANVDFLGVPRIKILDSCKGFLLCVSSHLVTKGEVKLKRIHQDFVGDNNDSGQWFFVCNFTTRDHRKIGNPLKIIDNRHGHANLHVNPSSLSYRIVVIDDEFDELHLKFHVYFSESRVWERKIVNFNIPAGLMLNCGVVVENYLYWLSSMENKKTLCMNLDDYTLTEMFFPEKFFFEDDWMLVHFGKCTTHLHLMVYNELTDVLVVMELDPKSFKWFERFQVDMKVFLGEFSYRRRLPKFSILSMICSDKPEEADMILLFDDRHGERVVSYHFASGIITRLCNVKFHPRVAGIAQHVTNYDEWDTFQYFETLTPINVNKPCRTEN